MWMPRQIRRPSPKQEAWTPSKSKGSKTPAHVPRKFRGIRLRRKRAKFDGGQRTGLFVIGVILAALAIMALWTLFDLPWPRQY